MKSFYCLFTIAILMYATAMNAQSQEYQKVIEPNQGGSSDFVPVSVNVGDCELGVAERDLDINNVRARLYNHGGLFWRSSGNVYTVPKDGSANSIFASGIWIGGLDSDGEIRFAGTAYGPFEYWPGPLDESGNPPVDCSQYDHLYKVSKADLDNIANGIVSDDIENWPYEIGAPVKDGDGNPDNYDIEAGDRPDLIGDQMVWWVMNDAGNTKEWSFTEPLGLEIQVTAFAFDREGPLGNTTFYRYRMEMKGDEPLSDVFFGMWADPDLGDASDDFVGSDTTRGLGIVYNGKDFDSGVDGYGDNPPALGYDVLQGPLVPDSLPGPGWVDPDGTTYPGMKRLPMTRFVYYTSDSTIQGNPTGNSDDPYQYLQGIWRDGSPMTFGGTGYGGSEPTHYMFPGNAADRAYWSEENIDGIGSRNTPADRRFLMSTGPIEMAKGDIQELVLAIVWSRAGDRLGSYRQLLLDDSFVQNAYQLNFETRHPLDAPTVNVDETDGKVVLTWENSPASTNFLHQYDEQSENLIDVTSALDSTYSFEGYQVVKFDSAADYEGEVVATYDVINGVRGIALEQIDLESGVVLSELAALGTDSGVQEYHTLDSLTNYQTYHYGVRAYAYNSESRPQIVFSPVARVQFIPNRVDARNGGTALVDSTGFVIPATRQVGSGSPEDIHGQIVSPLSVTGDTYELSFYEYRTSSQPDSVRGEVIYDFVDITSGDTLIHGVDLAEAGRSVPFGTNVIVADGVSFSIDSQPSDFTNFLVTSNGAGPITDGSGPGGSTGGAADFQQFPVPERASSNQQVGPGTWFYSTGDVGTGQSYRTVFIPRTLRRGFDVVIPFDYEIRFTPSCHAAWRAAMDANDPFATPANGCYGYDRFGIFNDERPQLVPFEIWNTGVGTPDDASDDFRMIPAIIDWEEDGYDLQFFDSSLSGATNDPETDWMYWFMPCDQACDADEYSPGTAGYDRWQSDILSGVSPTTHGNEIMARSVFVNWNGGDVSVAADKADYLANIVNQDMPESGTTFRLETSKPIVPGDVFHLDTAPYAPKRNDRELALEALNEIGITPNPYRARSLYQVNEVQDIVRFTNMPDRATIRIFTLSGTLVRTLEKDSDEGFLEWDLTNDYGFTIASGMYLIHVDVPDLGERVIKFGALLAKKTVSNL